MEPALVVEEVIKLMTTPNPHMKVVHLRPTRFEKSDFYERLLTNLKQRDRVRFEKKFGITGSEDKNKNSRA